jgi:RNA polymerase sigma-70 factor, ECF subfamily
MPETPPNPTNASPRSTSTALNQTETGLEGAAEPQSADAALLARIGEGDAGAMGEFFDRYSPVVYAVALRVLREPGSAEDVMQDVFLRIWRSPSGFVSGRASLGAWLVVVARNRAIDVLRGRKPADPVDDVVLASPFDVSATAERNIAVDKVKKALQTLPQEQQSLVDMAFFEGLTHSEIAARTGDPLGTVKSRIRMALMEIRKAMLL